MGEGVLHLVSPEGLRIPDPPLSQGSIGVLRDPAAQSHPGSILHISGFVALCELFLGCEAHFEL